VARAILEQNQHGVDEFLADHPEYSKLVYWNYFVRVASIFGRFGLVNPDGSRAVYSICSHIRHSCSPNAAWFTLRKGFPKGKKMLHVIRLDGISRKEEITVSEVQESILVLPKAQRWLRMYRNTGLSCKCQRCQNGSEEDDERIQYIFAKLSSSLATRPPSDMSTAAAQDCLQELDRLVPFSMQAKAKSKVLIACALGELSHRAAWQEENRSAYIVQWTGCDAESQEKRLKDSKKLYETAGKDFEYLLGQDALAVLQRMESEYASVQDQHKVLSKYMREKERVDQEPSSGWGAGRYEKGPDYPCANQPGMPPSWSELFKGKA